MTDNKYNCYSCNITDCRFHVLNPVSRNQEGVYYIWDATKIVGCMSHQDSRKGLMEDVILDIESMKYGNVDRTYKNGLDMAIEIIRKWSNRVG